MLFSYLTLKNSEQTDLSVINFRKNCLYKVIHVFKNKIKQAGCTKTLVGLFENSILISENAK